MVFVNIPYASEKQGKNLGLAYNAFVKMLPSDGDWACFIDHDAMFTTDNWYHQICTIIKDNPNLGAFGARTNRLNSTYQLVGNIDIYNHDIAYHRKIGKHLQKKHYADLLPVDKRTSQTGFSGVLILIKKSVWKSIGGFKAKGFNNVDNDLRWRLEKKGIPFHIMNGVYLYHWYKANEPYKRCENKFKKIDDTYQKENKKSFKLNNVFLYNGRKGELPV